MIALIFYASPLIDIVKWPFVIISAVLGVALAFLPLEERPLERWIFAFFKAIYTPTEFFWKKTAAPTKFFQDEAVGAPPTAASTDQEVALKSYLASTKQGTGPLAKLEGAEQGFLAALGGIFSGTKSQPIATSASAPAGEKKELKIPEATPIRVIPQAPTHLVVEEKTQQVVQSVGATAQNVSPFIVGNEIVSTKQAIFSVDAAPPNPPETPNVVVGQVVDEGRKIIEGAIMEIRDEAGRPVRALRSNKVGHFITVTPLDSGRYEIATEKEGYQFSPVSFEAAGALIPPILVEGRKVVVPDVAPVQPPSNQFNGQQIQSSYAIQ